MVGLGLLSFIYPMTLIVVSSLALIFIWGIAKIKSLAEIASHLEVQVENATEVETVMRKNNAKVKGANDDLEQGMVNYATSLGLMDNDIEALGVVEEKLRALNDRHVILIEEQRLCEAKERAYIRCQTEVEEEKKKENTKRDLLRKFDRADRSRTGAISNPDDLATLKKSMGQDKYLQELHDRGKLREGGPIGRCCVLDCAASRKGWRTH